MSVERSLVVLIIHFHSHLQLQLRTYLIHKAMAHKAMAHKAMAQPIRLLVQSYKVNTDASTKYNPELANTLLFDLILVPRSLWTLLECISPVTRGRFFYLYKVQLLSSIIVIFSSNLDFFIKEKRSKSKDKVQAYQELWLAIAWLVHIEDRYFMAFGEINSNSLKLTSPASFYVN